MKSYSPNSQQFTPPIHQITGTVVSSGTNIAYGLVGLVNAADSEHELTQTAVTDQQGRFRLKVPSGIYQLLAARSGFVQDLVNWPILNLGPSMSTNVNPILVQANETLSGTLGDAGDPTLGLPGVTLLGLQGAGGRRRSGIWFPNEQRFDKAFLAT